MPRYAGLGPEGQNKSKFKRSHGRFFAGKSRTQERIDNNLGIISAQGMNNAFKRVRCEELDTYDKYMRNEQYDKLMPWDSSDSDTFIPLRQRKPRVIFGLGKRMVDTVAAKLCGEEVFPRFAIEDDPDTEQLIQLVAKAANLQFNVLHAARKAVGCGSSFLRFYVIGATIRLEVYDSKHCYPVFDEEGQLDEIEIRYVFEDEDDLDDKGKPREKWYRMVLGREADIIFDNPHFVAGGETPVFEEVGRADHAFGFVQGTWFRTAPDKHKPDGPALIESCCDLIDAINYSLSQADQAVAYAQEPQLVLSGLDVEEVDDLIKSSQKAWNLGREGKAEFLEADLGGVEKGMELRDKFKQHVCDVARVCLLDPEKIVGSAQSAKAMEVLHGPLLELVGELRQFMGPLIVEVLTKITVTMLMLNARGENLVLTMPPNYTPKSLTLSTTWPPVFPMTMEDLRAKIGVAVQVSNASLISRESVLKWIAKDFGIENVEEEAAKVAAQPVINPFGAF